MLKRAATREEEAPGRTAQFLRAIDASADRLAVLTDDLLDVSRIRLGQLPLRLQVVDLADLVRAVVARAQDQLDDRHHLTLAVHGRPDPVTVDPDRTEQILTNLLDNAVKYSPAGGEVAVTLAPSGGGLLLSVRDPGIGLPAGETESIFEPFNRATNAARDNLPGMGLGLHICRSIAERHGGRIWAESGGEDQGTTMFLWLPTTEGLEVGGRRSEDATPLRPPTREE
jgi:signal transduction histidine kinase